MNMNRCFQGVFVCLLFIFLSQAAVWADSKVILDAKLKTAVIETINTLLIEKYIFLETAEKMKHHLQTKNEKGEYDNIDDPTQFAQIIKDDLFEISQDNHFFIQYNPQRAELILTGADSRFI